MNEAFSPHLEVLQAPQRRLWDELGGIPAEFTLYGGTAIALQLGHRDSVDFDFFSRRAIDAARLLADLSLLRNATVRQLDVNTLSCEVDRDGPVRLSFFGLPTIEQLLPPIVALENNLRVASLLDLAGTKASVVQRRAEAKDYIDIDAMLTDGRIDLPQALAAARAIYGDRFNPQITLKALSYFDDGDVRHLPQPLKDRLARAARRVNLDRLPTMRPIGSPDDEGRPR